uniref:NADH-ubiquinone oxidoreductase chain 4 n=1 Tax=Vampyroteuthis infernalis TaxID=55288 RepID=A7BG40_9MOLL|nr:NADH dehydrogenase subunit 4 [Vampyroteuthis infernalis]BAF73643.1 NADH dehydrogenase subunit 4 [Vampyroteuthis infernalis]
MSLIFVLLMLILFNGVFIWEIYMWIFMLMSILMMKFLNIEVWGLYSYIFYVDSMSGMLVILSLWISGLMFLASYSSVKLKKNKMKYFLEVVCVLCLIILIFFFSNDLFFFYIFFEISLIPTLLLIIGWGYQPERLQAGMYMMLYTISASLPLLLSIMMVGNLNSSYSMGLLMYINMYMFYKSVSSLWFLGFMLAFLVKLPMFFVHLWLPKAHVEAPVAGSMILAGVLLKLGGYGIIRFLSIFFIHELLMSKMVMIMALWGGVITSIICVGQSDIKSLIAYSSVGHMGVMLGGMISKFMWGWEGAVLMMIAHGLCSSGLFCLANLVYEKLKTRSLYLYGGMINVNSMMSLFWFLLCISNMGAPPFINLMSEVMLFCSLFMYSNWYLLIIIVVVFLAGLYNLLLFIIIQHGLVLSFSSGIYVNKSSEMLLIFLHLFPLLGFIFNISMLSKIFLF